MTGFCKFGNLPRDNFNVITGAHSKTDPRANSALREINDLPKGWKWHVAKKFHRQIYFVEDASNKATAIHPSLGALPKGWMLRVYINREGREIPEYYRYEEPHKISQEDPRKIQEVTRVRSWPPCSSRNERAPPAPKKPIEKPKEPKKQTSLAHSSTHHSRTPSSSSEIDKIKKPKKRASPSPSPTKVKSNSRAPSSSSEQPDKITKLRPVNKKFSPPRHSLEPEKPSIVWDRSERHGEEKNIRFSSQIMEIPPLLPGSRAPSVPPDASLKTRSKKD